MFGSYIQKSRAELPGCLRRFSSTVLDEQVRGGNLRKDAECC